MSEDKLPTELEQIDRDLRGRAIDKQKSGLDRLAAMPAEIAVPLLARLLESGDFMHRRIAVMGLGNHRVDAAFELLEGVVNNDRDPNVVGEAANSLFEFGDRAIPLLVKLFENANNWLVRQSIVSLLLDTECYLEILTVAEMAIADETQSVKEVGILALGNLLKTPQSQPAIALLLPFCEDPEWRNRWRAAIALQHLDNTETRAAINRLQQDEHFRVVAAALEVLEYWQKQA